MAEARLRFFGTGASGGTPGRRRSRRRESSLVVEDGGRILIDVTRHFSEQAWDEDAFEAVLITHAHRDASGGIGQLRSWWKERDLGPIPVYASAETIAAIESRLARLEHCDFNAVAEGEEKRIGPWTVMPLEVPHAREARYPTFAWRLRGPPGSVVYASDLARLTPQLERFCAGATTLIVDAAMWERGIFSHLTIDAALPKLCRWQVEQILLTQIGKTVPPHEQLEIEAAARCKRARPAYDGLVVQL